MFTKEFHDHRGLAAIKAAVITATVKFGKKLLGPLLIIGKHLLEQIRGTAGPSFDLDGVGRRRNSIFGKCWTLEIWSDTKSRL